MGNRAYQLALDGQRALQVFSHAIEGRGQTSDRVGIVGGHAGFQAALGNARSGGFEIGQTPLQLTHQ
ncbi:hypothetical protein D3C80_1600640 [compost metagenome]